MLVQISAGQGPEECQLAVGKLFKELQKEYPDVKMVSERKGARKECYDSITFLTGEDLSELEGSVLWICRSPFRPEHKRKNWFIDISIIPEKKAVCRDVDYRIEKFHCGGKGGQNVNKVESGVRVIHISTGIAAASTEERSQYMNKQKAIKKLEAILADRERSAREVQVNQAWQEHNRIVRGNPVRVYEGKEFKQKRPKTDHLYG